MFSMIATTTFRLYAVTVECSAWMSHRCLILSRRSVTLSWANTNDGTERAMNGHPTLLAVLLEERGLHRYGSFCIAYEKTARAVDGKPGSAPSRAQFHRWLTGELRSLPYTDHCRVLEHLIPGYTASQLFSVCPDGMIPEPARRVRESHQSAQPPATPDVAAADGTLADIVGVFVSRSEFASSVQPAVLFDGAQRIRMAGLSLNLICQQVPEQYVRQLVIDGAELHCLFLEPGGDAIKAREYEEAYTPGHLTNLTQLNIDTMIRLRGRLPQDARQRVQIGVYDETIRFNLTFVDDHTCVAQPYMPTARGVDSPTFLIRRDDQKAGLYPVFEQVFDAIAERSKAV
jgi:hypothetical protein